MHFGNGFDNWLSHNEFNRFRSIVGIISVQNWAWSKYKLGDTTDSATVSSAPRTSREMSTTYFDSPQRVVCVTIHLTYISFRTSICTSPSRDNLQFDRFLTIYIMDGYGTPGSHLYHLILYINWLPSKKTKPKISTNFIHNCQIHTYRTCIGLSMYQWNVNFGGVCIILNNAHISPRQWAVHLFQVSQRIR